MDCDHARKTGGCALKATFPLLTQKTTARHRFDARGIRVPGSFWKRRSSNDGPISGSHARHRDPASELVGKI